MRTALRPATIACALAVLLPLAAAAAPPAGGTETSQSVTILRGIDAERVRGPARTDEVIVLRPQADSFLRETARQLARAEARDEAAARAAARDTGRRVRAALTAVREAADAVARDRAPGYRIVVLTPPARSPEKADTRAAPVRMPAP